MGSRARLGAIKTPHGIIQTPAFVFCATKACVKTVPINAVRLAGTQVILSNTYNLMLYIGSNTIAKIGGLQKFTGWNGPMLTDSGGFQIFSLGYGSVAEEVKKNQDKRSNLVLDISEDG